MSEEEEYPYASFEKDGYEIEVIELESWVDEGFLQEPIPSDEERFAVDEGDAVKLIFHYAKQIKGKAHPVEHMWVVVTSADMGFLTGFLDNEPNYTKLLKPGQELSFHPEHIIEIWRGE